MHQHKKSTGPKIVLTTEPLYLNVYYFTIHEIPHFKNWFINYIILSTVNAFLNFLI